LAFVDVVVLAAARPSAGRAGDWASVAMDAPVRTSAPQATHLPLHPATGHRQAAQRPGGALMSNPGAIGPRRTPKTAQIATFRSRCPASQPLNGPKMLAEATTNTRPRETSANRLLLRNPTTDGRGRSW
jgi:hypothetical protein